MPHYIFVAAVFSFKRVGWLCECGEWLVAWIGIWWCPSFYSIYPHKEDKVAIMHNFVLDECTVCFVCLCLHRILKFHFFYIPGTRRGVEWMWYNSCMKIPWGITKSLLFFQFLLQTSSGCSSFAFIFLVLNYQAMFCELGNFVFICLYT